MSNSINNQINIPQTREVGSVCCQMVRNACPGRAKTFAQIPQVFTGYVQNAGHAARFRYHAFLLSRAA